MPAIFLSRKLSFYKLPSEFRSVAKQVRECDGLALKRLRAITANPSQAWPGAGVRPTILVVPLYGLLSVFLSIFLSCHLSFLLSLQPSGHRAIMKAEWMAA